jgi:putative transposase
MPRYPRLDLVGLPQHVVQRGNNRQVTFVAEADYSFYLQCLQEGADKYGCDVHAYVLMTNHVHLLATARGARGISRLMQSIGRRFVQYMNYTYRRSGTLWEGCYKASLVDDDEYLLLCHRYIELNPVRAGVVAHPGEYYWSSYAHHAGARRSPLIRDHAGYLALGRDEGERQAAYRGLFRYQLDPGVIDEIRAATSHGLVVGSERFKDEIQTLLKRRVTPAKRGRPLKGARDVAAGEQLTLLGENK